VGTFGVTGRRPAPLNRGLMGGQKLGGVRHPAHPPHPPGVLREVCYPLRYAPPPPPCPLRGPSAGTFGGDATRGVLRDAKTSAEQEASCAQKGFFLIAT